jgi:Transposase zinc-binding domain
MDCECREAGHSLRPWRRSAGPPIVIDLFVHAEKLVAFSCKKRGFCPSCGGRRMAETAALLSDEVLPERPLRQ